MTMVLGAASIDERGKGRGGKAGNQSGRELHRHAYYLHSKGWVGLRPVTAELGDKMAYAMERAIDNPAIGYDQSERNTLYTQASKVGFDPGLVTTPCETDCSALVRVCMAYAGIMTDPFNTASEKRVLLGSGKFVLIPADKIDRTGEFLRRGDILVTPTQGHTEMVLTNGRFADEILAGDPLPDDELVTISNGRTWWIRKGPCATYARVVAVNRSDRMKVYGERSGWYAVKVMTGDHAGKKGYISGKALL